MTLIVSTQDRPVPAPVARQDKRVGPPETLPAWTYNNAEFFALEREHLLLNQWQLACHQNEIRDAGSYATLDFLGERALVVRGEDGEIRAFHNVCRHRAAAVARGDFGRCEGGALRCFYHGWTYGLDGRLKAVPGEKHFPGLDKETHGLRPLPFEIWQGFVFVKFREGGPSIAERMAPYAAELDQYRIAEMEPRDKLYFIEVQVDWKNMMDNFLEGYHVPVGHPGLYRLFGNSYDLDVKSGDVSRAVAQLRDRPSPNWSERHYQSLLPDLDYLTPERQRAWTFYGLLPNIGFDIYPDQIDYFHAVPLGPGRCALRGRSYKLAGLSTDLERRLKACRYLSWRVNWPVFNEDTFLIESVQRGLESSSYEVGVLSEKEICVRQLHDQVRRHFPVAKLRRAPAPGTIAATNSAMLAASPAP